MGHIEDRWYRMVEGPDGKPKREPTDRHGKGSRYRVRYTAPDGRERSRAFPDREKKAAEAFLVTTETDKLRGTYIDPRRGQLRFRKYAEDWLASQTFDESTRQQMETRFRVHLIPTFGDFQLSAIGPEHVREWLRNMQKANLAQSHRRVLFANLSGLLSAAVDDERIGKNPCRAPTVKAPQVDARKVVPWTRAQVFGVRDALPEQFRIAVEIAAGCGHRQGEVFALAVEDVDFLRGLLHINRQVKLIRDKQVFALPKGRKTRSVPLSEELGFLLAEHIKRRPPLAVTLPWEVSTGEPVTAKLLLYTRESTALNRLLQRQDLEARARGRGSRQFSCEWHARSAALLCVGVARRGGERQGALGVPGPRRSGLHAPDVHAPDAVQ